MLYAKGIKENQPKSIKIKENPISDLEQQHRRLSCFSDDLSAPTMALMHSGELHDAKEPNPKHRRDRR